MSVIATLSVALKAQTNQFTSGIDKALKSLSGFTSGITSAVGTVGALGGALGIVVSAAKGIQEIANSFSAIDDTQVFADSVGLAAEELVGFRHAAELSGRGAESFDAAIVQMLKSLSGSEEGTTKIQAALGAVGLSFEQLRAKNPAEAFRSIADAVSETHDPILRAQVAFSMFGKSGSQIIPVLAMGSKGLNEMQADAEKLGITFSRMDWSRIDVANDAIARLKAGLQGIANAVAGAVAPALSAATEKFSEWATQGGDTRAVVLGASETIAKALAHMASVMDLVIAGWHALKGTVNAVVFGILKPIDSLIQGIQDLEDAILKAVGVSPSPRVALGFSGLVQGLAETANEEFAIAGAALDDFISQTRAAKVHAFFDELDERIQRNAVEAQKSAASTREVFERMAAPLESVSDLAKSPIVERIAERIAELPALHVQEFSPSRTFLGNSPLPSRGVREQKVRDPQIAETNKLLQRIEKKTGGGFAVLAP